MKARLRSAPKYRYALKRKSAPILGVLAFLLGLGGCDGETGVEDPDAVLATVAAVEDSSKDVSSDMGAVSAEEGGGNSEEPVEQDDASVLGEAPHLGFPVIRNMFGYVDSEVVGICFGGEEFQIDWSNTEGSYEDSWAVLVGVGNCEGKGYPALGHGWRDVGRNAYHVCFPARHQDEIRYYSANGYVIEYSDGVKKTVRISYIANQEFMIAAGDAYNLCNKHPGPEDVVSWN